MGHRPQATKHNVYLGHLPEAKYVGMNTCRSCHENIYLSFLRTGMGQSFASATRQKSVGDFQKATIYDKYSDFYYHTFWRNDSLNIAEYRLQGRDTLYLRTEQVNYIIGSGQHTNSHMQSVHGYLYQMPMTFYAQQKRWDLPPGFEGGVNTRFSRKIGLECMTCHNSFPDFVMGSENKFTAVPQGIDCERCHGPGSYHVQQRTTTETIDTSKYIDYSIVNPAKLSVERQFDICQRCHLQGNAILKPGKSFFDFKPGQKLSDFISVFMPRYKNGEDQFIMASHAERLKMSPCFIQSLRNVDTTALRPYKNAMTCVTCHNPHVSVKETSTQVFNNACQNCHSNKEKLQVAHRKIVKWGDCVSCHMPRSGSIDIPHVTVHDHFIRKPMNRGEKKAIAEFLGLYSVNEKNPDPHTKARAYLDQYEKFKQDPVFLDSAEFFLRKVSDRRKCARSWIQLFFVRKQYPNIIKLVRELGGDAKAIMLFKEKRYDNADAWACYRIGEAFNNLHEVTSALTWYRRSCELAPFNLDFRNKLGAAYLVAGDRNAALKEFDFIISENPSYVSAYSNIGYLRMLDGQFKEAQRMLMKGNELDPDNELLLLNLATCQIQLNEKKLAIVSLQRVLRKNPAHRQAAQALKALQK